MKYQDISYTIGNTPVVRLAKLFSKHDVWIKIEKANPGGSIKDRIALAMIEDAERRGVLKKKSIIIEATSGNTGIGLAMIGAVKGYQVVLVMAGDMSQERVKIMRAYGAKIVLSSKEEGTQGAIKKAQEMEKNNPRMWRPSQHNNRVNITAHMQTTAKEIIKDFPEGIDVLITATGTGGHISALALILKKSYPRMNVFAAELDSSPVLSGGIPKKHRIAGISPGFIPKTLFLDKLDGIIQISEKRAIEYTQQLPKKEGILAGLSTGAALAAVEKYISKKKPSINHRILTLNYDTGERYLSVAGVFL